MSKQTIEQRVRQAAEKVLNEQNYVSAIDVLLEISYLQYAHLDDWRKGQVPYLESVIQVNLDKISMAMKCFREWAEQKNLKASETKYLARTRGPKRELRFSKSGHPTIEKAYRTHYLSPLLSEKKQQKLQEKLDKPPEQVVFWIIKNSQCSQCHKELPEGSFLYKEQDQVLSLKCAGFDDLVNLGAGNATLTRRTKQYSKKYAVVVKFSRTRKRYERQGLLVEASALQQAENELEK